MGLAAAVEGLDAARVQVQRAPAVPERLLAAPVPEGRGSEVEVARQGEALRSLLQVRELDSAQRLLAEGPEGEVEGLGPRPLGGPAPAPRLRPRRLARLPRRQLLRRRPAELRQRQRRPLPPRGRPPRPPRGCGSRRGGHRPRPSVIKTFVLASIITFIIATMCGLRRAGGRGGMDRRRGAGSPSSRPSSSRSRRGHGAPPIEIGGPRRPARNCCKKPPCQQPNFGSRVQQLPAGFR